MALSTKPLLPEVASLKVFYHSLHLSELETRSVTAPSTPRLQLGTWVPGTHVHDVGAVVKNLHIGLQDVEMEGRCQHATVAAPLVTSTQQEAIP